MNDASDLPDDWRRAMGARLEHVGLATTLAKVEAERARFTVYPPRDQVFSAFHLTPFAKTRVLVVGQDPYHGEGQAHGLAFSVKPGIKPPPSLVNIYKELASDVGAPIPTTGDLTPWTEQGILLMNTALTVREGEPGSHAKLGWGVFTDAVIETLSDERDFVVFALWGNHAKKKAKLVGSRHAVVETVHPSPLSARAWFGSKPFSRIDDALRGHGLPAIDWHFRVR
jgi:uracil-DNA glycosylase